jgi:hypothetical protein
MHWVQHEVLASQGGASCKDLCFILEGKVGRNVSQLRNECCTWQLLASSSNEAGCTEHY